MKVIWSSNAPWSVSGYGQQTALTVPRIAQLGHQVAINCFFGLEGGTIEWNGIPCLPTDVTRFGNLILGDYADKMGEGDRQDVLVMTLMDVWVMQMQQMANMHQLRFACWTPVDHDPAPPGVVEFLQKSQARIIAMSRFGQNELERQGFSDVLYVPHMVDTKVFAPDPGNKQDYREGMNIPRDSFVVGMVACNQGLPSRKSFPQVFQAFAEFHKKHSDAILYVHADVLGRNQGVNLPMLAKACGIPDGALRTSDQTMLHLGIAPELMPGVFNSFDVLAMPSFGEGFGIPLIEAQSCGIPVITTNWTAMTEHAGPGWLVEGDKWWDQLQGSWQKAPYISEIVEALEDAYENADSKREASREFALGFDVEHVFETMWKPVLQELEQPREIAPLKLAA